MSGEQFESLMHTIGWILLVIAWAIVIVEELRGAFRRLARRAGRR